MSNKKCKRPPRSWSDTCTPPARMSDSPWGSPRRRSEPNKAAQQEPPLAISLTLLHADEVNYTTALLAGIEAGLACAVAGIPVADLARIFWRHGPPLQLRYLAGLGIDEARVGEMMTVVSPLAFEPRVPFMPWMPRVT